MQRDRRRHERQPIEAPVWVWGIASGPRNASRGRCINLTEAGAGAIIFGTWLPGQVVTMELGSPESEQVVSVQARLSYRIDNTCGFEFLGIEEATFEQLRSLFASAS